MRLLLSLAGKGHELCLAGYDWDTNEVFWTLENEYFTGVGICYDGNTLIGTATDKVTQIGIGIERQLQLSGEYAIDAHSVHIINDKTLGVVDTGNSRVIIIDREVFEVEGYLCPIESWGSDLPWDAIHLNDFAVTPYGILASAFGHQEWRVIRERVGRQKWFELNHGVVFNLTSSGAAGACVVGCGLSHPHTLIYRQPYVYAVSSSQGWFHQFEIHPDNYTLSEISRVKIADEYWIRGATHTNNAWYIGGIKSEYYRNWEKRVKKGQLSIFEVTFDRIKEQQLNLIGAIYDVLPWKDEVMNPLIDIFAKKGNISK